MYNEVIYLVTEKRTVDQYGDMAVTETRRAVYANMESITRSEFYQSAAVGMKPEIKFVLPDFLEYHGEKKIYYTGYGETSETEYDVIRTYRKDNTLEIVCNRGVDK